MVCPAEIKTGVPSSAGKASGLTIALERNRHAPAIEPGYSSIEAAAIFAPFEYPSAYNRAGSIPYCFAASPIHSASSAVRSFTCALLSSRRIGAAPWSTTLPRGLRNAAKPGASAPRHRQQIVLVSAGSVQQQHGHRLGFPGGTNLCINSTGISDTRPQQAVGPVLTKPGRSSQIRSKRNPTLLHHHLHMIPTQRHFGNAISCDGTATFRASSASKPKRSQLLQREHLLRHIAAKKLEAALRIGDLQSPSPKAHHSIENCPIFPRGDSG